MAVVSARRSRLKGNTVQIRRGGNVAQCLQAVVPHRDAPSSGRHSHRVWFCPRPAVVTPLETETEAIDQIDRMLASAPEQRGSTAGGAAPRPALVGPDGSRANLPESVYQILRDVVRHMARGDAISLVPRGRELTTQQAAKILSISRPFLIRLLDRGDIPYTRVGTHRRLKLEDVLAYRERRARVRRAALDRLAVKSQKLDIY